MLLLVLIVVLSVAYGAVSAILGAKNKYLRVVLFLPIALVGLYILFAIGVTLIDDFRRLFPSTTQYWGTVLVGEVFLAATGMAAGWIVFDGVRTEEHNYITLGGVLLVGVSLVYWQTFHTDHTDLSPEASKKFALQSSPYSCSAMSLANLCTIFDVSLSERAAAEQMRLRKFGGSVQQLSFVLEHQGLYFTEAHEQTIEQLTFPAILIVDFHNTPDGHAILVLGRTGEYYHVVDPLQGPTKKDANWFARNWRGKGLQGIGNS